MKFNQGGPYKACHAYLINWMTSAVLQQNAKLWQALITVIGNEDFAKEACTWGKGPLVEINSTKVPAGKNGNYPRQGDTIFIHSHVAIDYEEGRGWMNWEATVLHEMCHWARRKRGLVKSTDQDTINGKEAGQYFEELAYGCNVHTGTWSCKDGRANASRP